MDIAQFRDETIELVVRVSRSWKKGDRDFPKLANGLYEASLFFDRAVDPRSGATLEDGGRGKIIWHTPKKHFGFPYGHDFEAGHLYHLALRRERESSSTVTTSYYLERVIARDVFDPRLDPALEFAGKYQDQDLERVLLTQSGPRGWATAFGHYVAGIRYLAFAADGDASATARVGHLRWREPIKGGRPRISFAELGTYRAIVRESKDDPRALMLVKLLGKVNDPRFDTAKADYLAPVVLHDSLCDFTLDKRYDWYSGVIDWLGTQVEVLLNVETGETDASMQLAKLHGICADMAACDARVRAYAAQELLEGARDWAADAAQDDEEPQELSAEQFQERITPCSISIGDDGSVDFNFDDGNLFWGHVIIVSMDANGEFTGADIAG
ncbi:MAG: DUF2262 domain-containing protein [Coriobacteriales bacterium]|nr:DUF2262 domain-containing protein [Coriobacteriales bacterium]MBQ6586127.1 DUF2262 domain-containing protein [Coriobacteriales bacterium]